MTDGVTVTGLSELVRTLRRAGADLEDLKQANARAGGMIAQWGAVTAPRRSGALGGSVRASKRAAGALVMAGSASVPYAGPIHWGWAARHIAAQPWLSQAARDTEPAWLPIYLRDIQRVIDKIHGA